MGNNAVNVNLPYGADIHITNRGSSWLWAVFVIFSVATLAFIVLGHRRAASDRIFNYFTSAITLISALTYFALASNLGFTAVPVEFVRSRATVSGFVRQVFWARYIQWFLNIILIVLALLLTARVPTAQILFTVLAAGATIVFGLAGALTPTRYKWGFFVIAIVVFLYVVFALFHPGRRHSGSLGSDVGRAFKLPSLYALAILLLYPIAWGVSEGGNVIAPDSEAIFYGILDILLFIGFGAILTFSHRSIEPSRLGLRMRTHDEELGGRHRAIGEKHHGHAGTAAGAGITGAGLAGAGTAHHHGHSNTVNGVHDGTTGVHTGHSTGAHGSSLPGSRGHEHHTHDSRGTAIGDNHATSLTGAHHNTTAGSYLTNTGASHHDGLTGTHHTGLIGSHNTGLTGSHNTGLTETHHNSSHNTGVLDPHHGVGNHGTTINPVHEAAGQHHGGSIGVDPRV